jgi:murein DD-endopeptidase MepM/ murein hydrolase activator NlpD
MSAALPLNKSSAFFKDLQQKLGKINKLDPPRTPPPAVIFNAHFERGMLELQLSLNQDGEIAGLYFKPHVSSKPAPEKHRTKLFLPFRDRWLVFWGGDSRQLNYHHDVPNQRFAFDLIGVGPDGKTHRGEGKQNEDYYAFGREVLAPADGTVTDVIVGVRDNVPESMNPYSGVGNCVIIQHRDDEFSVLAHFKQGTIRVKVGEKVTRGQVLGLCGNSGNSSEPHIHYHLQHTAVLQDGLGIKPFFEHVNVIRAEKTDERTNYSPIKGDIISP